MTPATSSTSLMSILLHRKEYPLILALLCYLTSLRCGGHTRNDNRRAHSHPF